jgi:hypothetical protein
MMSSKSRSKSSTELTHVVISFTQAIGDSEFFDIPFIFLPPDAGA